MKTYRLSCTVTVSAYTDVEAKSLEAAIAEAESRPVEIGSPASGHDPTDVWLIEDADGEPEGIYGDEA
jgi:hypothetical protein